MTGSETELPMRRSSLRGILRYVPQFRGRVFIVEIDGALIASPSFTNILLDLAVLRSLGIRLVIVFGAAYQVRKLARERGVVVTNSTGDGVTDEATLEVSIDASTRLQNEIMRGLTSVDLNAAYANAIRATPVGIIDGVDYRFTGKIQSVDSGLLEMFLGEGIIPLIPPLGFDVEGNTFRVNSDAIAVRLAQELDAIKILFLTDMKGVEYKGEMLREIPLAQLKELIANRKEIEPPAVRSILSWSVDAFRAGIPRVHILDGRVGEPLLSEIFSNEGVGTMLYTDDYAAIKPVTRRDLRSLTALLHEAGVAEDLRIAIQQRVMEDPSRFFVMEIDLNPVALLEVSVYQHEQKAELHHLLVSKGHTERGHARQLLDQAEQHCKKQGVEKLLVAQPELRAKVALFDGFQEGNPQDLPIERREWFQSLPEPKAVLVKRL